MEGVKSVSEFLMEIDQVSSIKNVFYRGHANKNFKIIPGIYRSDEKGNSSYLENEDLMYSELVSMIPDEFEKKDTLQSLTLMQHYGLPTRILDLTENALVGLYFACKDELIMSEDGLTVQADGEVIVFDIKDEDICYYNSDKVSILANITKCKNDFSFNYFYFTYLNHIINDIDISLEQYQYNRQLTDLEYDYLTFLNKHNFFIDERKVIEYLSSGHINIIPNLCIQEVKKEFDIKRISSQNVRVIANYGYNKVKETIYKLIESEKKNVSNIYFKRLISYIREDKPYFQPEIDPRDLSKVLLIKPKLNNPRIIRQQGSFFIFGIESENKKMVEFNDKWIYKRIKIHKDYKENIRKELKNLGIYSASLFPEIDKVTDYIKDKFNIKTD